MAENPISPAAVSDSSTVERHPRGLYTLFFTEMWERFSYYGMRALLVLFMTQVIQKGGMGLTDKTANAIYGLYTAAVYLASLPGGWLADRLLGAQKAVWYGGIIIAAGHFTMAIPQTHTFFLGLILVVLGTGLLKPNISVIVGGLYPEGGTRRDAGFTVFYMGINLGAFLGPLVCGTLGENFNWHYGFGAAGVGMVLGLAQYRLSRKYLGGIGLQPGHPEKLGALPRLGLFCCAAALILSVGLSMAGIIRINPVAIAQQTTYFIVAVAVVYFAYIFFIFKLDATEKRRVGVIVILFIAAALFWSGFEQAGSSLNLFAKRYTVRTSGFDFTSLATNDITDLPLLVGKLTRPEDEVSKYAWSGLNDSARQALTNYAQSTNASADHVRAALFNQLNKIINGDPIYDEQRFAGVKLSEPTSQLLEKQRLLKQREKHLKDDEVTRLNRLLLEDTYPSALAQNQSKPTRFVVPASWFQSLGPIFVITFAPVFASLWVRLARRKLDPSIPVKFGLGLILLGLGFLVMAGAAVLVSAGNKVWPTWLITTYLIHTFGELCLSPVGLSSVTKLAPGRLVGQMMGVWFLAASLGNLIAGLLAGEFSEDTLPQWPVLYLKIVITPAIAGLLLILLAKPIKRWTAGIK